MNGEIHSEQSAPLDIGKIFSDQQKSLRDEIIARIGFENTLMQYIASLIGAATAGAIAITAAGGQPGEMISAIVFLVLPIATTPLGLLILHHESVIGRIREYLATTWKAKMEQVLKRNDLPLEMDFDSSDCRSPNGVIRRWGFVLLPFAPCLGGVVAILRLWVLGAYCHWDWNTWVQKVGVCVASAADLAALAALFLASRTSKSTKRRLQSPGTPPENQIPYPENKN